MKKRHYRILGLTMALAVAVTNVQVTDIFAEERAGAAESTGMAAETTPEQSPAGETETAQEETPAGETPEAEQQEQEDGDSENISYSDSETEETEGPEVTIQQDQPESGSGSDAIEAEADDTDEGGQSWEDANSWRYQNGQLIEIQTYADARQFTTWPEMDGVVAKGIDVSEHQGKIDWYAVAEDGVDGVFVRLGYRGYTKGALNIDDYFYRNIEGAQAAGLDVGVYFYSQSINSSEAREEAEFVLDALEGYELQLPVVYDIEGAQTSAYRTYGVSTQTNTNMVMAFCDTIWEAGYDTMYYSYTSFLTKNLDISQLQDYDLWVAQYYPVPFCPYNFQIWQYDYEARVDGINYPVDLNLLFLDYEPSWWAIPQES